MENDRIPPHNRGPARPAAATAAPTAPPPPAASAGGRIAEGTGRPVVPAGHAVPRVAADPPARAASRPTAGPYPAAGPPVAGGAPGGRDIGGRLPSEDGLPVVSTVAGRVARPGLALAGDTALLMNGARV
ncbi:hypothetical protein AB0N87_21570 [Streptomyces sp. NPDC093228]|jgi:hypothetical protein|uniref:hypothetical protein n=1 Tax=unclassified Streptomyces TaxID=2593676 RepID=UPI0007414231|nr:MULTISPECIES: hypothetical protein [unclassified Streptomyces]KUJ35572.1 hypothetical protein ADL25_35700 [Streptomyces sp. NRRL F-5122]MDX3260527.1 hypothetical protein [Streptomyces sp. MI02-2A]REE63806.1 hypothetical protein BX257_6467 [Streptomyces sp. 3212.3]